MTSQSMPLGFHWTLFSLEAADITQAYVLVEGVQARYALMDKTYDSDKLIE
ncbi:hypothetical protein [Desulfobotulus alkaliphilus]|uniref:hypothetical protein n=1 Tax=Desulfobotulus alkaliphilus TaxID=622671 RepID=UPI0016474B15|nr:hypothetical protein [Desulfobotulus alkaliphilus]